MELEKYFLFDTELGWIALAWKGKKIIRIQLPGSSKTATEKSLLSHINALPATPHDELLLVVDKIKKSLDGNFGSFSERYIDVEIITSFQREVYRNVMQCPAGKTISYGELAKRIGYRSPIAARAIGQALSKNPYPIVVPCHRVVGASGKLGGFTCPQGIELKRKLLLIEGVELK